MTLVRLKFAVPEAAGQQPSAGALRWTPTKRRTAGDWVVMPAGFTVALVNGEATVEVDPTGADWVWRVDENVPSSQGGSRYVAVPDLAEIEYRALVAVDPSTLEPSEDPDPAWYAYVDTLEGQAATASASAVAAKVAAEAAQTSATGSQTSAAASAATATTKATEASTSATNAATSATTALGHKDAAAESAGAAANSQVAAANSATSASNSATAAANSDTHATEMADIAQSSASDTIAAANGFSIGTVTTGAPGDPATATITGTAPDKRLNLGLPKGETGPANSLSVLETTTGPETAGATGPQGVKGDKGDPGGITLGTGIAANTDWNTLTADGVYRIAGNTGQINMPGLYAYGILYVNNAEAAVGVRVNQVFYPATTGTNGRIIWSRGTAGGTWSAWRSYTPARWDTTAGRVAYQWDPIAERDQLVYGDTGWRLAVGWDSAGVVTGTLPTGMAPQSGKSGGVYFRRYGNTVWVSIHGATATAASQNVLIPTGFAPGGMPYPAPSMTYNLNGYSTAVALAGATTLFCNFPTGSLISASNESYGSIASWSTVQAWPTTLPGTASGSIPNL